MASPGLLLEMLFLRVKRIKIECLIQEEEMCRKKKHLNPNEKKNDEDLVLLEGNDDCVI